MSPARKGGILGGAAIVALAIGWALAAGHREGDCIDPGPGWSDGCQCDPVPAATLLGLGVCFGTPWGVLVGAVVGALASQLERARAVVLAAMAAGIALVLAAIATSFLRCSTDPSLGELFARAAGACVPAGLLLERWTRPLPALPSARDTLGRSTPPRKRRLARSASEGEALSVRETRSRARSPTRG